VASALVAGLAPQHPGQSLACVRAIALDGKIREQRSSLLVGQRRRLAVGPAGRERTEHL
jgi:hypothetical protein